MKASMTSEMTGLFARSLVWAEAAERSNNLVRNGLSMTPWRDGLPIWRTALARLPGATFYHCESWIEALRSAYPIDLQVATLQRDGEVRAAAVFARSKGLFSTRLVSLPFSDCGGALAIDDDSHVEFLRALASSNPTATIEVRGAAGPEPWKNVDYFGHWTLNARRPFREISAGFSRSVRGGIKRSLKDRIRVDRGNSSAYMARFFDLQLKTRRRLGVPPQPFRFFSKVHENFARGDRCDIWFATLDGRDEAGMVLLREGDQLCYKWSARPEHGHSGANHLLVANMIEAYAGKVASIDLGRCDMRNQGLVRSKVEIGCVAHALSYAFFPKVPPNISSEVLNGPRKVASEVWKRLPLRVTRVLGEALYRYMA